MDGVITLLAQAQSVGLTVRPDGEHLEIRGPRSTAAVAKARALVARKACVLAALQAQDDEFHDLRAVLACGCLRGYGPLGLSDRTVVLNVVDYTRLLLDELEWPQLAANAARHLRLLRE